MRSIVLYGFIVGLPIVGISMVLKVGRDLPAPPAVWGSWSLQLEGWAPGCSAAAGLGGPTTLTIGQSGDHLVLSFGDSIRSQLSGQLRWGQMADPPTIEAAAGPGPAGGRDIKITDLRATLDPTQSPATMAGTLETRACGAETSAVFRATRHSESDPKGGGR